MTSSDGIASSLRDHWETAFQQAPVDEADLQTWLQDVFPRTSSSDSASGLPPPHSAQWEIQREDVVEAISLSGSSSPGPDGIPYLAWKCLGSLGVDTLWNALRALLSTDGAAQLLHAYSDRCLNGHDFNLGILVCLPKKASGSLDDGTSYYTAANTRPLSIVNTDNWLLASAVRIRLEPILD